MRVDLFAEPRDARRQIDKAVEMLKTLLPFSDDQKASGVGADQGTGATPRPRSTLLVEPGVAKGSGPS